MMKKLLIYPLIAGLSISCGKKPQESAIRTVEIPYTPIEKQSLGNCWNFGLAGWVEALVLKGKKEKINLSESYFLYKHLENQLKRKSVTRVQGAAYWAEAISLLLTHGIILEKNFIAAEVDTERSDIQAEAVKAINTSLKDGILAADRSDAAIYSELDKAFGVSREEFSTHIISASNFVVDTRKSTLSDTINDWQAIEWERLSTQLPARDAKMPLALELNNAHDRVLKSVKKALHDQNPILVFFNSAKDFYDSKTGIYQISEGAEQMRQAAGHMALIKDYTSSGVNPKTGEDFFTGEGDLTENQKFLALEYGEIQSIILKNSWGQASGYDYLGTKGHLKLESSYLNAWVKGRFFPQTTLQQFFIPKKYLQENAAN